MIMRTMPYLKGSFPLPVFMFEDPFFFPPSGAQLPTRRGLDLLNSKIPANSNVSKVHVSPGVIRASQCIPSPWCSVTSHCNAAVHDFLHGTDQLDLFLLKGLFQHWSSLSLWVHSVSVLHVISLTR